MLFRSERGTASVLYGGLRDHGGLARRCASVPRRAALLRALLPASVRVLAEGGRPPRAQVQGAGGRKIRRPIPSVTKPSQRLASVPDVVLALTPPLSRRSYRLRHSRTSCSPAGDKAAPAYPEVSGGSGAASRKMRASGREVLPAGAVAAPASTLEMEMKCKVALQTGTMGSIGPGLSLPNVRDTALAR